MTASRAAHHAPKSLKNLSHMHRTIPELSSCEKMRLRILHSAARKPFAKGFDGEERAGQCKGWEAIRSVTTYHRRPRRRNVIMHSLGKQRILVIGGTSGLGPSTGAATADADTASPTPPHHLHYHTPCHPTTISHRLP